jgi:hypothetical protein
VSFVLLSGIGAPGSMVWSWAGRAGLLAASLYLAAWSFPTGKAQSLLAWRDAKRIVKESEFRKLEAYREIVTLRARIASLEKSLAETEHQRDEARRDIYRVEQEARAAANPNFVTAESITPEMVKDARRMIQYWFASAQAQDERRSLSRNEAEQSPYNWSQPRHRRAQGLLRSADVLHISGTQPQIVADSMDVALRKLSDYVERKRTEEAGARAAAARTAQARYGAQVEI